MNLALVAIVLAIGAGAVVAVSTREPGMAPIGLAVALVAAALLADPLPSAVILGVRVTAALLAATIIRWASRGGPRQHSPLGWPSEALLATAGAVAGLGLAVALASVAPGAGVAPGPFDGPSGPIGPGDGPSLGGAGGPVGDVLLTTMALTIAAGMALLVLGAAPMVHGRPGIRRAIGLVLVAQAVLLLRLGVAGPAVDLEEIARAALLVACAAAGAALARATAMQGLAGDGDGAELPTTDTRHLATHR
jgi:multisubunit Na+/H+ antiporter MnhC subunit